MGKNKKINLENKLLGLPDGLALLDLVVLELDEVDAWLVLVNTAKLKRKNPCIQAEVTREA